MLVARYKQSALTVIKPEKNYAKFSTQTSRVKWK